MESFMVMRMVLVASFVLASLPAQGQETAGWVWRVGLHSVQPKSDNHAIANVDSATTLTFDGTYLFASHWGVELLAAVPFAHDINLNGAGKVAETKHLPPTLSVQYHFNPGGTVRPYVGAGLNYTLFFSEKTTGALAGADLNLDPSFGPAAQLGMEITISSSWFINMDARWMDIDTDAKLNGTDLGAVEIDPYAFGLALGRRF
jgi:outer membrane protein